MRPIQMVDTKTQYLKIKEQIDTGIHRVLDSAAYINGEPVQAFAKNLSSYLNVKHTITCGNGTDALQIAMMALGLQPGDEVITPSFTYVATTEVVALLRLKPVFVEVDRETFNIDPKAVEAAITLKTKAIVPVHLYGQAANMEEIMAIANRHNLFVVEDNAQAIGSNYTFADGTVKKTGTIGTVGTTSFYPSKNLGAYGDGGAIFTNDDVLAKKLQMIANHGQEVRYYHEMVGCNSRLDSIQAAVLDVKLKYLDEYIAARQKAASFYDKAFESVDNITVPKTAHFTNHVYHQYTILVEGINRDELSKYLSSVQIPSMIYYPVPAHRQKMFAAFGGADYKLPVTDWLTERVISLPIHTELDEEQLQYIVDHVLRFINK
ncbi:DegT/DnrJ/EryC1/StrS family aminotransferase [Segetibacter sp.]|jgi:UDP-2-acetamido-2-deoxy-ribo-hexuluronate aminotransferase|uniref:DegT/DnrJ/EryC1/StrS family aminotransferase n=1 Tax=Segetibacter sp. TaxID=2231182 RepID=UPI002617889C|nr:DegT/DnrJ/EryC1/StrS family aminotransferase [Segetibacter sp.]MCW3080080.1 DegT/DnrJ/EryC1/StrS family aminotransferase [Segetibacter sp.]